MVSTALFPGHDHAIQSPAKPLERSDLHLRDHRVCPVVRRGIDLSQSGAARQKNCTFLRLCLATWDCLFPSPPPPEIDLPMERTSAEDTLIGSPLQHHSTFGMQGNKFSSPAPDECSRRFCCVFQPLSPLKTDLSPQIARMSQKYCTVAAGVHKIWDRLWSLGSTAPWRRFADPLRPS